MKRKPITLILVALLCVEVSSKVSSQILDPVQNSAQNQILGCNDKEIEIDQPGFGVVHADSLEGDGDLVKLQGVCLSLQGFDITADSLESLNAQITLNQIAIKGVGVSGTALKGRRSGEDLLLEGLDLQLELPDVLAAVADIPTVPLAGKYRLQAAKGQMVGGKILLENAELIRPNSLPLERYALGHAELQNGQLLSEKLELSRARANLSAGQIQGTLENTQPVQGQGQNISASLCRVANTRELALELDQFHFDRKSTPQTASLEGLRLLVFGVPILNFSRVDLPLSSDDPRESGKTSGPSEDLLSEWLREPAQWLGPQQIRNALLGNSGISGVPLGNRLRLDLLSLEGGEDLELRLAREKVQNGQAWLELHRFYSPFYLGDFSAKLGYELRPDAGFQARVQAGVGNTDPALAELGWGVGDARGQISAQAGLASDWNRSWPFLHLQSRYQNAWENDQGKLKLELKADLFPFENEVYGQLYGNVSGRWDLGFANLNAGFEGLGSWGNTPVPGMRPNTRAISWLALEGNHFKVSVDRRLGYRFLSDRDRLNAELGGGTLELNAVSLSELALSGSLERIPSSDPSDFLDTHWTSQRMGISGRITPDQMAWSFAPTVGYDFAQTAWDAALEFNFPSTCFNFRPVVGAKWNPNGTTWHYGFKIDLR